MLWKWDCGMCRRFGEICNLHLSMEAEGKTPAEVQDTKPDKSDDPLIGKRVVV
jgi:hypothetical protein